MSGLAKTGFDKEAMRFIAGEIHDTVKATSCQLAVVIGGGNMIRGSQLTRDLESNIVVADQAGMLATIINGILLQDFLERTHGLDVRVMSAVDIRAFAEPYIRRKALSHLTKGHIIVLTGGMGNPRFSTDSCAVLRAIELNANLIIKGTKVNGVYDKDPHAHDDSKFIKDISQHDFVAQRLGIMDRTAVTLAGENNMPIRVFNIFTKGNLEKVLEGKPIGSLIMPS